MCNEITRILAVAPGMLSAIWYGVYNAARYGQDLGRKTFLLHYVAQVKSPPGKHHRA